jgi:hypothetical protein
MQKSALTLLAGCFILTAAAAAASPTAFGNVDSPKPSTTVYGVVAVKGWVLDINAVDNIKIYVDGTFVNTADINLPRPDVLNVFPTYVLSPTANPGFITSFFAAAFSNGAHVLTVLVTESDDPVHPITLATIPLTVDNSINQPPFGYIDIPGPVGVEGANSAFPISGWALDDTGVDHVDFMIDGLIMAGAVCCNVPSTYPGSSASSAVFGTTRPDVQAAFPQVPHSIFSGFQANIDSTSLVDGIHVITVRVTDVDGASRVIGTRTIQVDNAALNLHPFGTIDSPLDELTFPSVCTNPGGFPSPCTLDICTTPEFLDPVSGWVLDTGARLDFGQTGYVQLLIDNVVVADTRSDCIQNSQGAFENCYGVNRPDVEEFYPGFVNSDNAGYVFDFFALDNGSGAISVQLPIQTGDDTYAAIEVTEVVPGKHTISVRAGDDSGTVTQIAAMSANFVACTSHGDFPAFGYVDAPLNYQFISGRSDVVGWAYDTDSLLLSHIDIDVDGQVVGQAFPPCPASGYGYGCKRPDVPINDARVPTQFVGFKFSLDTTKLADSPHDLNIYYVDHEGNRDLIGRRKFVVNNNVETHGN